MAGLNIGTDMLVWLCPLPVIWGVQLPKRQRVILRIVFGLGIGYVMRTPGHMGG